MRKYAIISDIHGNNVALRNVMDDAKMNGVDAWIFAGDYCVCAPWPKEVTETLQNMKDAFIVKGNEENYLHCPEGDDGQFEISRWSKRQLSGEQIEWLDQLPEQLEFKDGEHSIYITHKSETFIGPVEYDNFGPALLAERKEMIPHDKLLDEINGILDQDRVFLDKQEQMRKGIYIFGHSHIQWHKEIYVWSSVMFQDWIHSRNHIDFFLQYAEDYANEIGDSRRPLAKETWRNAFEKWELNKL